jgi:hypothetical protein
MTIQKVIREMNDQEVLMTGHKPYSLRYMTMGQAWKIFQYIDMELSPEWLYQDGERSRANVQKREALLNQALEDLKNRGYRKPDYTKGRKIIA